MENSLSSIAMMTMARMPFLSAREKILLASSLGGRTVFDIGLRDAEDIVRRRLDGERWDCPSWAAAAERDAAFLSSRGASSFSYFDPGYPAILRETSRPPFMLYVRGRLPDQESPAVAIVGTRYPTGRGLETASDLAREAAESGVAVVSGLARGVDSAAHRGALAGGGTTFAVFGRGIDEVYPAYNKELAARMVSSGGGLVSEYPPGTPPSRWTFPERNRILAGLCRSIVVVEAPGDSGALISAAFALEEGRDVYVAAACLGGVRSSGSDALAADGAVTLESFGDIIEDWRGHRGGNAFRARRSLRRRRMRHPGRRRARARRPGRAAELESRGA